MAVGPGRVDDYDSQPMTSVETPPGGTQASVPFVDLRGVFATLKGDVLRGVDELLDTGAFVNGPHVSAFEDAWAAFCGARFCVGVSSGLDALRLGLTAAGLEPGAEVVVPAMTFVATFEAVVQAGGRPVVVDVTEDDANVDVAAAEAAVGPATGALLPVHLYGQMADVEALARTASRHALVLLEDACQAHGARRAGIRAGTAGAAGAFSFYPSKNLGAMGDAGALVTDDEELAGRVHMLRQHGEASRYRSERIGYTARLDAIQALALRARLPRLDAENARRREAAAYYSLELEELGDLRLPTTLDDSEHVWHLYTVRTADPEALTRSLAEQGISTGRHYPEPPHLAEAFAFLGLRPGAFPVAEAIGRETLSLPLFPDITEAQLDAVVRAIRRFFGRG